MSYIVKMSMLAFFATTTLFAAEPNKAKTQKTQKSLVNKVKEIEAKKRRSFEEKDEATRIIHGHQVIMNNKVKK